MTSPPMSGRKKQAARNDELILQAARTVFTTDPGAPISAVADRAGVGISALYRRYPSKDALLQKLCSDGLQLFLKAAREGLAVDDPWEGFATFVRGVVAYDSHSLTIALAGTFPPTEDLFRDSQLAFQLSAEVFERAQQAGVLRPGLVVDDLAMVFEQLASIKLGDAERIAELRERYLTLILDALRNPPAVSPLPGPPPTAAEIGQRWVYTG
ncbi:TetR/AcrR family transcriptional regulator [Nonomuraea sp. NPDC050310]|uniref:TetR/AcrR family transcriptional regulator n=1 Tax=unclassified Nonomuraea TaxID=2593643 RepID=UPI0033E8F210